MTASTTPPHATRGWTDPVVLAELFLASNIAFLGVDILGAHAINQFAKPAEWIPVGFSIAGPLGLVLAWLINGGIAPVVRGRGWHRLSNLVGGVVGWGAIALGVAGLVFHLESQFFRDRTIASLVYTAPFAAPLAYTGLGLLALLNRKVQGPSVEWAGWVLVLALGGFVGNFVLCLADHVQNGFFHPAEWLGVGAAAFGVSTLAGLLIAPASRLMRRLTLGVMGAQILVGLAGFGYHVAANLSKGMPTWWENFLYGAPAFAPLLFVDLAALAILGLHSLALALPIETVRTAAVRPAAA